MRYMILILTLIFLFSCTSNELSQIEQNIEEQLEDNNVVEKQNNKEPTIEDKILVEETKKPELIFQELYKQHENSKLHSFENFNVQIEVNKKWKSREMNDPDYYPGITLHRAFDNTWRNQIRLGFEKGIGKTINITNYKEITRYFEEFQKDWCESTKENPVYEVSPTEEGYTTCLEMGRFNAKEIRLQGRQAFQVTYDYRDEFRLPNDAPTKDVFSDWIVWINLIPYGNDLIHISGYTIKENQEEQEPIIQDAINSFKVIKDGRPVFVEIY